jgi:hypothetical protein
LFARSQQPVKAWELHSKARYVQVLAPFCRYLNDLGEERVEILGRKEMGILRRAELEGLRLRLRSRFRSARGAARGNKILARSVPDLIWREPAVIT